MKNIVPYISPMQSQERLKIIPALTVATLKKAGQKRWILNIVQQFFYLYNKTSGAGTYKARNTIKRVKRT